MFKILITGTGRCGTTFLIKLFSFLGFDTGFTRENYNQYITSNSNAGMERLYTENHYILKNPKFIHEINHILKDTQNITLKQVIIPIRNYSVSAQSRARFKNECGGLWNAKNEAEQLAFYNKIISNYIFYMTKHEINTLFLDFNKMTHDKQYLFEKLKHILEEKNITFEFFEKVYDEVSEISKPTKTIFYNL